MALHENNEIIWVACAIAGISMWYYNDIDLQHWTLWKIKMHLVFLIRKGHNLEWQWVFIKVLLIHDATQYNYGWNISTFKYVLWMALRAIEA